MRCQELLSALNEFVDGETQSALCRALEEHLADCDPCRIVIDNIRHTITLYRDGQAMPLPAGLHEKIHSVLRDRWAVSPVGGAGRPEPIHT
jgi:predicted anti-sigma-YlaC factor YlaD